jgi:uncharacterized protein YndB with AHSA1/START domain
MKKLRFTVTIQAPPEKIWHILWDDASYRAWTSVFAEGSHVITDWKEGNRVEFVDPSGCGMYGRITQNRPPQVMAFEHLGEIKDGIDTPSEWSGAKETYFLQQNGSQTTVIVEMESTEGAEAYFEETFPKAMLRIKELSEHN